MMRCKDMRCAKLSDSSSGSPAIDGSLVAISSSPIRIQSVRRAALWIAPLNGGVL